MLTNLHPQASFPDRYSGAPPVQPVTSGGNERIMSAGEHRAERGEGRMKPRFGSWLMQLAVWTLFLGMIIAARRSRRIRMENEELGLLDDGYQDETFPLLTSTLFTVFFFVTLMWYGWECWDAGTREFVANLQRELNVQQHVQRLRETIPVVQFTATCSHQESRTRLTTDSNGRTRSGRLPVLAC